MRAEPRRFSRRWSLLCVVQAWFITASHACAQVQFDRVYPAAISSGAQSTVVAEGKFPSWPVSVESSHDDVEVSAGKDPGRLQIAVAEGASPGVAWLRIFDSASVSKLVPIIISPVSVTEEKEPNDKRNDGNRIELPTIVSGRLQKSGDSDGYRVKVERGRRLVVSATANQVLQSPMDAVLQITDARGNVLAQSDDRRGLDPQLVFTPETDEELIIRIFAFPSTPNSTVGFGGSAAFVYTLDVTQGPFLDHAAVTGSQKLPFGYNLKDNTSVEVQGADRISPPIAYSNGALGWSFLGEETAGASRYYTQSFETTVPTVVLGHIRTANETHTVSFLAKGGTKYRAEARSKADGFLLDSKLDAIESKSGNVLASNDDVARGGYDAAVEFTPDSDGDVEIRLTEMLDAFGPRHFYRLSIRPVSPTYRLNVSTDRFVLKEDEAIDIAVAIKRQSGFSPKIRIEIEDLPEGVTCKPVISESKGETAKAVKLKLEPGRFRSGHYPIRVVGRALDTEDKPIGVVQAASYSLQPSIKIGTFWLTLAGNEKAEDK